MKSNAFAIECLNSNWTQWNANSSPTGIDMILILAGNHQQATWWKRHQGIRKDAARYIDHPQQIRGGREQVVALVGTYWTNPNYNEMRDYLGARGVLFISAWVD